MARNSYEHKICKFISEIFINTDEVTQLIKATARLTTYKLERQIEKLADKEEAYCFAECVTGYYLTALRARALDLESKQSLYVQLSYCLLKYEPESMFAFISEKALKTNPAFALAKWTARGAIKESGIVTREGSCLAHQSSKIVCYGYRLGSVEEAKALNYQETGEKLAEAHPLVTNPFRYQETVEATKKLQVLTWERLLENLKLDPQHTLCLENLIKVTADGVKVILVWEGETVPRRNLLQLAGCLNHQSRQVSDASIGQLLNSKVENTTIVLTAEGEVAAELLVCLIEDIWLQPKAIVVRLESPAKDPSEVSGVAENTKVACPVLAETSPRVVSAVDASAGTGVGRRPLNSMLFLEANSRSRVRQIARPESSEPVANQKRGFCCVIS